ncbi:MAG: NAD kinase [Bacteroidaceae bacterium]|nr:NAD kinase [Bacteroidaceae bacterium]
MKIAVFGNIFQQKKSASVQNLLALLAEEGEQILIDKAFHDYLTGVLNVQMPPCQIISTDDFEADVAVSMGGDGTFLEAARRVGSKEIPILGLNMGRLGYLSDFSPEEMEPALAQLRNGTLRTESRTVLQMCYSQGEPEGYPYALNEVAVLKRDNSSMISIRVDLDGEYLTTYQADGLIINTPTGSTGYALSVGGPIMSPGCGTLGLVPVAPHSLNVRPLTIGDDTVVSLRVESRSHNFLVSVDGRSEACSEDIGLTVRRAPYSVNVLKHPDGSFFRTIRDKLMWGADNRR